MTVTAREVWLNRMAANMAPRFEELGYPLPSFRVSIGFTSGGVKSRANAEVWSDSASGDGHHEIFIRPDYDDPVMVSALLFHELTHCAVGFKEGHAGKFAKVMLACGMKRPMTSTVPTDVFADWVRPYIDELGPIPHAALKFGRKLDFGQVGGIKVRTARKAPPADQDGEGGEIYTTAPPKQTTRLRKAECGLCGYTVRVTQKWLDVGPPHCPTHGAMEALDEA